MWIAIVILVIIVGVWRRIPKKQQPRYKGVSVTLSNGGIARPIGGNVVGVIDKIHPERNGTYSVGKDGVLTFIKPIKTQPITDMARPRP